METYCPLLELQSTTVICPGPARRHWKIGAAPNHQRPPISDYCTVDNPWRRPPRIGIGIGSGVQWSAVEWWIGRGIQTVAASRQQLSTVAHDLSLSVNGLASAWQGTLGPGPGALSIFYIKLSHFLTYGQCNWYAN
nr:uncharacterized protein LOC118879791 isoform X1 [Drosophila suzukii]